MALTTPLTRYSRGLASDTEAPWSKTDLRYLHAGAARKVCCREASHLIHRCHSPAVVHIGCGLLRTGQFSHTEPFRVEIAFLLLSLIVWNPPELQTWSPMPHFQVAASGVRREPAVTASAQPYSRGLILPPRAPIGPTDPSSTLHDGRNDQAPSASYPIPS